MAYPGYKPDVAKAKQRQEFPEDAKSEWMKELRQLSESKVKSADGECVRALENLLIATTVQDQLKELLKLGKLLKKDVSEDGGVANVERRFIVATLVSMHSLCMCRHPLQRALTRLLNTLPYKESVTEEVRQRIQLSLGSASVAVSHEVVFQQISYLEALMENFPIGNQCLQDQIVTVLSYFDNLLQSLLQRIDSREYHICLAVSVKGLVTFASRFLNFLQSCMSKASGGRECDLPNKSGETCQAGDNFDDDISLDGGSDCVTVRSESVPLDIDSCSMLQKHLTNLLEVTDRVLKEEMLMSVTDLVTSGGMLYITFLRILHSAKADLRHAVVALLDTVCSLPELSQVCLIQGLISKVPHSVLLSCGQSNCTVHEVLFLLACEIFDHSSRAAIQYVGSRVLCLWTKVTRDMCYKGDIMEKSSLSNNLNSTGATTRKLLFYIWSYWEHPIEGIPHQMMDIFANLLMIHKSLHSDEGNSFTGDIITRLLSVDHFVKPKYIFLGLVLNEVSVDQILQINSNLPSDIMSVMEYQTQAPYAGNLWVKLLCKHQNEAKTDVWGPIWLDPLFGVLCNGSQRQRMFINRYCLSAPDVSDSALEYLLCSFPEVTSSTKQDDSILSAQLECLKLIVNRSSQKGQSSHDSYWNMLDHALKSLSDDVKVAAMGLLCECRHTTEPPMEEGLNLILKCLPDIMNSQSPLFRQQIQTLLKQLFRRIFDSGLYLLKKHREDKLPDQVLIMKGFMTKFATLQFCYITPLVSFQRRTFAMNNLDVICRASKLVQSDKGRDYSLMDEVFDLNQFIMSSFSYTSALVHCLQDSSESNKDIALGLLLSLPFSHQVIKNVASHFKWCYWLMCTPKAVDCTTSAYNWRLLLHSYCWQGPGYLKALNKQLASQLMHDFTTVEYNHECNNKILAKLNISADEATKSRTYSYLLTLYGLLQTLQLHHMAAQHSLLQASLQAPMYGVIQTLWTILKERKSYSVPSEDLKQFCDCLVNECLCISKICLPVVCNSSPEGFMPDYKAPEMKDDVHLGVHGRAPRQNVDCKGVPTAQSLLLCCWHSMKEISLLFGEIVVRKSKPSSVADNLISPEKFCLVGDFFITLLNDARHRGAFEMGYVGFKNFCSSLWTINSPNNIGLSRQSLKDWLDNGIQSLQTTSIGNITRRSGGLPYYFQAILSSAPPAETHQLLEYVFKELVKVVTTSTLTFPSKSDNIGSDSIRDFENEGLVPEPAAVHALNVLRALVKDTKLGESILPFLSEVYMLAVEGYASEHWAVRNSSTMLFTSLQTRIFGVKTVQDEHQRQNKMTSRKFFAQFPDIGSFLRKKLESTVLSLEMLNCAVFPILLSLSRLSPSPLDDKESDSSLEVFIPLLKRCASSPVWKVRALTARTFAAIVPTKNVLEEVLKLLNILPMSAQVNVSHNKLHGILLMISELVTQLSLEANKEHRPQDFSQLLESLFQVSWLGLNGNSCCITKVVYLKVVTRLIHSISQVISARKSLNSAVKFEEMLTSEIVMSFGIKDEEWSCHSGLEDVLVAQCVLLTSLNLSKDISIAFLQKLAENPFKSCRRVLCRTLFELHDWELSSQFLGILLEGLKEDETMEFTILRVIGSIISASDQTKCDNDLSLILEQALTIGIRKYIQTPVREVVLDILTHLGPLMNIKQQHLSLSDCASILQLVSDASSDGQQEALRISASEALKGIWIHILHPGDPVKRGLEDVSKRNNLLKDFWNVFILVVFDDAPSVRSVMQSCLNDIFDFLAQFNEVEMLESLFGKLFVPSIVPKMSWCVATSFRECPHFGFEFLITELNLEEELPVSQNISTSANVLFEEGPINEYREEFMKTAIMVQAAALIIRYPDAFTTVDSQNKVVASKSCDVYETLIHLHNNEGGQHVPYFSQLGSSVITNLYKSILLMSLSNETLFSVSPSLVLIPHTILENLNI